MIRHEWQITPAEAIALQKQLAQQVRIEEFAGDIRTVAGVDCAFTRDGRIIAAAVLCDAASFEVIATAEAIQPCQFPYIPGLLSFREAPAVIAAVEALSAKAGPPDLLMCDGQGTAHPRGLGLACHVGLWLDMPAIGVAKSRLTGKYRQPGQRRRCRTQLRLDGKVIGTVLRTRDNVKPLFISPGHRVSHSQAVKWALRAGQGLRIPEPTRQADILVASLKRQLIY